MREGKYPKVLGWMAESRKSRKSLAIDLGLSYTALDRRLFEDTEFRTSEIKRIMELSGKTFDELFM